MSRSKYILHNILPSQLRRMCNVRDNPISLTRTTYAIDVASLVTTQQNANYGPIMKDDAYYKNKYKYNNGRKGLMEEQENWV